MMIRCGQQSVGDSVFCMACVRLTRIVMEKKPSCVAGREEVWLVAG